mmetsp:Transcript_52719/g.123284  ORF Transcript_52719/g.123284 Transcript_52719/m.123284 type:complete len:225 (+) Transcript_52719:186-860(+)
MVHMKDICSVTLLFQNLETIAEKPLLPIGLVEVSNTSNLVEWIARMHHPLVVENRAITRLHGSCDFIAILSTALDCCSPSFACLGKALKCVRIQALRAKVHEAPHHILNFTSLVQADDWPVNAGLHWFCRIQCRLGERDCNPREGLEGLWVVTAKALSHDEGVHACVVSTNNALVHSHTEVVEEAWHILEVGKVLMHLNRLWDVAEALRATLLCFVLLLTKDEV